MGKHGKQKAAALSEISQYKEYIAIWICLHQEHRSRLMLKIWGRNNQNWMPVA